MDKEKATETNASAIAPKENEKVTVPIDDLEAKNTALEAEKARLIEESANYKMAYLKEKNRKKEGVPNDEDDEEKMRRIAQETLANSRLAEIAREQDAIIKKALKENKELKLTQKNRPAETPVGIHTEGQTVQDTSVTPEQLKAFKDRGWSDKDIERYKKNLKKNSR